MSQTILSFLFAFALSLSSGLSYGYETEQSQESARLNQLGIWYINDFAINHNLSQASELFKQSADKGNPVAQYNLGVMYLYGFVLTKDVSQAIVFFSKSAEQGDKFSRNVLWWVYLNGLEVQEDRAKAEMWYKKTLPQEMLTSELMRNFNQFAANKERVKIAFDAASSDSKPILDRINNNHIDRLLFKGMPFMAQY